MLCCFESFYDAHDIDEVHVAMVAFTGDESGEGQTTGLFRNTTIEILYFPMLLC